ncbi:MAG: carbohydrate ABC transporter permease [Firmicutes bacterium]|nr:carbohydrate ABC transporter permease [Bacillota bacterium]
MTSSMATSVVPNKRLGARRWRVGFGEGAKHLVVVFIVLVQLMPLGFMLLISFKSSAQFLQNPFGLTWPFQLQNYTAVWPLIARPLFNSVLYGLTTAVGSVMVASISAFVLARYQFPGRELLYYAIIMLLMIPGIMNLVPAFLIVVRLHLYNTPWAIILPGVAGGQVMAIFLLRTFFGALPEDLFEAARIDGASMFQTYAKIALPLSFPIIFTAGLLQFFAAFNDFIWPSVVITAAQWTPITVAVDQMSGQYGGPIGPEMAAYTIASLPLLVLFALTSRQFIRGMISGAIKM